LIALLKHLQVKKLSLNILLSLDFIQHVDSIFNRQEFKVNSFERKTRAPGVRGGSWKLKSRLDTVSGRGRLVDSILDSELARVRSGLVWIVPLGCVEVVLGDGPDEPREVLSKLKSFFVFDQAVQAALMHALTLVMHLNLVLDPIPIFELEDIPDQLLFIRRHGPSIVAHLLLRVLIVGKYSLPLLRRRIGSRNRKISRNLVDLLARLG